MVSMSFPSFRFFLRSFCMRATRKLQSDWPAVSGCVSAILNCGLIQKREVLHFFSWLFCSVSGVRLQISSRLNSRRKSLNDILREPLSTARPTMLKRSRGALGRSYISVTPPVKSSKPSDVLPPDRAS
ncbi:hypothetical protein CRUP_028733 [Coryphaenoides rupestris]|nr:hypothetical protein CRUP_028733 [Coryphaenoides rupestris]